MAQVEAELGKDMKVDGGQNKILMRWGSFMLNETAVKNENNFSELPKATKVVKLDGFSFKMSVK